MDRPPFSVLGSILLVDRIAEHVPQPTERHVPYRHGDRLAGIDHLEPAGKPVGGVHRHRPNTVVTEVLLHLRDQRACLLPVALGYVDSQRVVDLGQLARKDGVDDHAFDLDDPTVLAVFRVRHLAPGKATRTTAEAETTARGAAVYRSRLSSQLYGDGHATRLLPHLSIAEHAQIVTDRCETSRCDRRRRTGRRQMVAADVSEDAAHPCDGHERRSDGSRLDGQAMQAAIPRQDEGELRLL